jgi:hypothetical protein
MIHIYIYRILIDDNDTKGSPFNAFDVLCHFIISFLLIYKRRHRNKRWTDCIYMWPIGIKHMHTRINGISLSYRHRRRTKKRRERERKKCTMFFVLSMNVGRRKKRPREKKYLPDIHFFIVVGTTAILIGSSRWADRSIS